MKTIKLLIIGLTLSLFANGQTIKIQGGTSISKLNLEVFDNTAFNNTLIGYSFFVGMDYFDKKYCNLSSNIGMFRRGGKHDIPAYDENGDPLDWSVTGKITLDYVSLNTMIDLKYPIKEKFSPFISVGPRLDYLAASNLITDAGKEFGIKKEKINGYENFAFGLLCGAGLRYDISNFQFGVRTDYYVDFTKIAKVNATNLAEITANTFTINLTLGYKLNKK
ncbi:MAG: PorT family protein [Bacteroidetes bacterium]|nr:PorT family protein [Bacteroidota bacterium]